MAKWRSRAHSGPDEDFFGKRAIGIGNSEQKSRRRRNRLADRSLRIEPCEERKLFAVSPTLIAIIPNEGSLIDQNDLVTIAPRELTIRFDDGQLIDPSSLSLDPTKSSITVVRSGGDDNLSGGPIATNLPVNIGFIGLGEFENEVVIRFAENLPDDKYRVRISGGLKNTEGDAYNNGTATNVDFDLNLGAQVVAVVPQPVSRGVGNALVQTTNQIVVYFNNDDLNSASAQTKTNYQLIRTNGTATNLDDAPIINPTSVVYDNLTDKATLTFAANVLTTAGTYRLRVGNSDPLPVAPQTFAIGADPGSTIGTANNLGTLFGGSGFQSAQLATSISAQSNVDLSTGSVPLPAFPGSELEPGHRQILQENHLLGFADTAGDIPTIFYNFQDVYGSDPDGNILHNLITDAQKQRAREVFSLYSTYAGVQFVESDNLGLTIATGDLRAVSPLIPTGPGGVAGIAGLGLAVMDLAEDWGESEFGGSYFIVAMHEIGHLLGLGHTYDLPPLTIMGSGEDPDTAGGGNVETAVPGDHDIVHMRHMYRPDGKDIDTYRFTLAQDGTVNFETIAQRLATNTTGWLDSVISVYNSNGILIGRNDDYFGRDAFLKLDLTAGEYYVAISASGNTAFDLNVLDSGIGGRSQGDYKLQISFNPTPSSSNGLVDATGILLDGDADGRPGGEYNFWFNTQTSTANPSTNRVIWVDKASTVASPDGTLAKPFANIALAFATAEPGDIVRIVGNGGDDGNIATIGNNFTYNIGFDIQDNGLSDGSTMEVPKGVTVMIDAGAIFRLREANIDAGSSAQGIDRSGGAIQVLGTPTSNVIFTSWHDQATGKDIDPSPTTPAADRGDWGGLVFREDSDLEQNAIFLNYVNNADIRFGGGRVVVDSQPDVFSPIHMIEARPTVSFNKITLSADAAMSADPNSFQETLFGDGTFAADYDRVGPDIHGNTLTDNSFSALFVRVKTESNESLTPLTTQARFDDTDIVHVLNESLIIAGDAGGAKIETPPTEMTIADAAGNEGSSMRFDVFLRQPSTLTVTVRYALSTGTATAGDFAPQIGTLTFDPGETMQSVFAFASNDLLDESNETFSITLTNPVNTVLTKSTATGTIIDTDTPGLTAWVEDEAVVEGDFLFPNIELSAAPAQDLFIVFTTSDGSAIANGDYDATTGTLTFLAGNTFASNFVFLSTNDDGAIEQDESFFITLSLPIGTIGTPVTFERAVGKVTIISDEPASSAIKPRVNARLAVDPGIVVKLGGSRIEAQTGGQFVAEASAANPAIFTSIVDDSYGRGGTFDTTDNDAASTPAPGDWSGFYFGHTSSASIDHALVTFAGGSSAIEGEFANFNAVEIQQARVRIANSTFQDNAGGADGTVRKGRLSNGAATIFVRGAQPTLLNNVIRDGGGPAISINVNALNGEFNNDPGRSTGAIDLQGDFFNNSGPLVAGNRLGDNPLNGMLVRGGTMTTEGIWDDTDIVHLVQDEIVIANFHTSGGLRLQSKAGQSLVVKLDGDTAGFTAGGRPLDINDRIGGTLQVVGVPGAPVVLTSLADDSVGAGLTPDGKPNTDTDNNGNNSSDGTLPTIPDVPNGLIIDNNVATDVVGHIQFEPDDAGNLGSGQDGLTAQGNTQFFNNENFVFSYTNYVDTGASGQAIDLSTTTVTQAATLVAPDTVRSSGTFQGPNGVITWTVTTTVLPGETKAVNTIQFSSPQAFGNVRFINYLDEDVSGTSDDILWARGTPGAADFLVFTLDGPERVGFAQGGAYDAAQGLVNATWNGWAADEFSDLRTAITGAGSAYTPAGTIDLTDLPVINDPALGTIYGPNDVTSSFSWTLSPTATTATVITTLEGVPTNPGIAGGAWRSIKLDRYSNDRNVGIVNEVEQGVPATGDSNATPNTAQLLGGLAPDEKSGDDNLRLGYEVHGSIAQTYDNRGTADPADDRLADVDVYSFRAKSGTEIWLDIDRTTHAFDSIVELVDANGSVIARSNDSEQELSTADPVTFNSPGLVGAFDRVKVMQRDEFGGTDHFTTNPRDGGLRVTLPGNAGVTSTYYVRVRANSGNLLNTNQGTSKGNYKLQLRLREIDENPGSTVQYADIRFATNGVEIIGKPEDSPLLGEVAESGGNNDITTPQDLGNLLEVNRNTLAVSGFISAFNVVDWYRFDVDIQAIQSIAGVNDKGSFWPTVFDLDYADGSGRVNASLAVFDQDGNLVYWNRNGTNDDDQPGPLAGADTTDLTRGSFGPLDPYIGSVDLKEGGGKFYYVAVSSNAYLPLELTQFTSVNVANPFFRLEPVAEYNRVFTNRVSGSTGDQTITLTPEEFHLGDVVLYLNSNGRLFTADPFTGEQETDITGDGRLPGVNKNNVPLGVTYGDIAMRNDGRLFSFTQGPTQPVPGNPNDANSGNYRQIDTGVGTIALSSQDDGIVTFQLDPNNPINADGTPNIVKQDVGLQYDAMAYFQEGPEGRRLFVIGSRADGFGVSDTKNLLFELNPDTAGPVENWDPLADPQNTMLTSAVASALVPGAAIIAAAVTDILPPTNNPGDILDGLIFSVTGLGGSQTFEFNTGPEARLNDANLDNKLDAAIADGENFSLNGTTFEFDQGVSLTIGPGAAFADQQTFSVTDSTNATVTFEFDLAPGNGVSAPNTGIVFFAADTAAQMATRIANAINASGLTTIATVTGSRITMVNDNAVNSPIPGIVVTGNYGVTGGSVRIPYEDADSVSTVGNTVATVVDLQPFTVDASYLRGRLMFLGATTFSFVAAPSLTYQAGSNDTVGGGSTRINVLATDTASQVAAKITAAINGSSTGVTAAQFGGTVQIEDATNVTTSAPITFSGAAGAGGTFKGLAGVNGQLYGVTDKGGFYGITAPGTRNAGLVPIATINDEFGDPVVFAGMTDGPENVEGGIYDDLLFATDENGVVYAFDITGALQPIFLDGASSIDTGVSGTVGITFSTLDYNLWHTTGRRSDNDGHSGGDGATSWYFGLENPDGAVSPQPNAVDYNTNAGLFSTYDVPGGAYGTLTTSQFSLAGYTAADQPTFYFSYYYDGGADLLYDTARVFISDDGANWELLALNGGGNDTQTGNTSPFRDTGTWRQARIDLGAYAGIDTLRMRFDFSSAGDMEVGENLFTGEILRALPGSELRDGEFFIIDGVAFEFDLGPTVIVQSGPLTIDGDTVTVNGTAFEFIKSGVAGLNQILILDTDAANDVAAKLAGAIAAAGIGVNPVINGERVNLPDALTATETGTSVIIEGAQGVTFGVELQITAADSAADVAQIMAIAIDEQFVAPADNVLNLFQAVKVDVDLLHIIGHNVDFEGPLPFTDELVGDLPTDAPDDFPNRYQTANRGQDNAQEGLYLDDFIIGMAARGEQGLFAAAGTSTYVQDPNRPNPDPNIVVGHYDLEIRRGSEPLDRVPVNPYLQDPDPIGRTGDPDADPDNWFPVTRDFRERLDRQMTLIVNEGSTIVEGETFRISDGQHTVTFEFDSNDSVGLETLPNGSQVSHIPVPYTASSTAGSLAAFLAGAINARFQQTAPFAFKVRAVASGTDGRVELVNAASVEDSVSVSHQLYFAGVGDFALGDQNQFRDQGYTIVANNRITSSLEYNIVVDSANRDEANQPHPSAIRNLREINAQRLVPGISIYNNLLVDGGDGGIHFSGDGSADGAVPFGRIVNNTIFGDGRGVGVLVDDGASPTILNNILAANDTGIQVANGPGTVLGSNIYQSNDTNTIGIGEPAVGGVTNFLAAADPLFVDAADGNFYLDAHSKAIDTSRNSLTERTALATVISPLGIPVSPILAPTYDLLGQLRVDDPDPLTPSPPGQGANVFKDRGAIDRADFIGSTVALVNPIDNDASGLDKDPDATQVLLQSQRVTNFSFQFSDGTGAGISDPTVTLSNITFRRGATVVPATDYIFSYDTTTNTVRLQAAAGIFADGIYTIEFNNSATGIRDIADNPLKPNQTSGPNVGKSLFTIELAASAAAPWQNPGTYPFANLDVNGSGLVTPIDAGLLIDRLNRIGIGPLPLPSTAPPYFDVNGDGFCSPADLGLVIDYLNRVAAGTLASFESSEDVSLAASSPENFADVAAGLFAPSTAPMTSNMVSTDSLPSVEPEHAAIDSVLATMADSDQELSRFESLFDLNGEQSADEEDSLFDEIDALLV